MFFVTRKNFDITGLTQRKARNIFHVNIVAGVALLWRQKMREENTMPQGKDVLKSFREWLRKNSHDTNKNGWDNELGFGVLKLDPWKSL